MLLLGMEYILLDRALSNSISRATRTPKKFIITEGIYLSYQRTTNLSRHHPPKAVFSTAHRHLNYETNKKLQILPKESVSVTADINSHVGVLLKRTTVSADWSTPHRYDRSDNYATSLLSLFLNQLLTSFLTKFGCRAENTAW